MGMKMRMMERKETRVNRREEELLYRRDVSLALETFKSYGKASYSWMRSHRTRWASEMGN
ncbi:hypothetical protein TRIATDRAFT_258274 [Trichoderma atroviride IMI 206040]|uniref:Uncharacterized protein n=1 Tax=Hypocrea atroviridis (strain ATCC 20476 / IMI 206040) TaxID=452589 RepID=G9P3H9_HYPAI|nr:uncharacterized protein TRIATDRAFT_258274 [Trichoderma atroviride IMI 206040]EHK42937.1 hypothetical protein TRIATDRAFT_258274 [Trichoderma atroviride IMI 206040]